MSMKQRQRTNHKERYVRTPGGTPHTRHAEAGAAHRGPKEEAFQESDSHRGPIYQSNSKSVNDGDEKTGRKNTRKEMERLKSKPCCERR